VAFHDDLLEQARHLANRGQRRPRQASLRRAVSAAYYALFHLLVAEGTKSIRPTAIRRHVRRLYEHGNMKVVCKAWGLGNVARLSAQTRTLVAGQIEPGLRAVAAAFVDLQEARHAADYDLSENFTKVDSLTLVNRASQAFIDWQTVRSVPNAGVFLAALLFEKQWNKR